MKLLPQATCTNTRPNTHLQYPGLPLLLCPWQLHVTSPAISGGPPPPLLLANSACTLQTEDLQRNNSSIKCVPYGVSTSMKLLETLVYASKPLRDRHVYASPWNNALYTVDIVRLHTYQGSSGIARRCQREKPKMLHTTISK